MTPVVMVSKLQYGSSRLFYLYSAEKERLFRRARGS